MATLKECAKRVWEETSHSDSTWFVVWKTGRAASSWNVTWFSPLSVDGRDPAGLFNPSDWDVLPVLGKMEFVLPSHEDSETFLSGVLESDGSAVVLNGREVFRYPVPGVAGTEQLFRYCHAHYKRPLYLCAFQTEKEAAPEAADTTQQVNPDSAMAKEVLEKPQMWYVNARYLDGYNDTVFSGSREACQVWATARYEYGARPGLYNVEDSPLNPNSWVCDLKERPFLYNPRYEPEIEAVFAQQSHGEDGWEWDAAQQVNPETVTAKEVLLPWEEENVAQQVYPADAAPEEVEEDRPMPWEGLSREDYNALGDTGPSVSPCDGCKHDFDGNDLFCMACRHNPENWLVGQNAKGAARVRPASVPPPRHNDGNRPLKTARSASPLRHNDGNAGAITSYGVAVQDMLGHLVMVRHTAFPLEAALAARVYAQACAGRVRAVFAFPVRASPPGQGFPLPEWEAVNPP